MPKHQKRALRPGAPMLEQRHPDADPELDAALANVLADGAAALARARAVAEDGAAGPARQALAWAIVALVALREDSLEACEAAAARAQALAGPTPPARVQDFLAHVHAQRLRHLGQLAESRAALATLNARADQRSAVDAYLTLGSLAIVASMLGDNDAALDSMYQALHLARRSGVQSLVVNALSNLGSFEADLYNLEDAVPLLEEALAGAQRIGSRRQLIFAAGNLVQCLTLRGDAPRALQVAREQLMPAIRPDDPPSLRRDDEIAHALLANGLVDEAAALLQHEVYEGTMTNELATARVGLEARIRIERGDPARALALCLDRLKVLGDDTREQVTPPIDHVDLLRIGARAAAAAGEPARAFELLDQAFTLHQALLGRAAGSRRLSLQIEHRLRQAEWERDSARQIAGALEGLNASLRAEATENERLKRQLMAHALEDPLTGLPNRRHLFDAARRLFATQVRRDGAVAAALIDLDHFKQVNDRHGHDAGDAVLVEFARRLQQGIRAGDIACRYGGEEFVLLMVDATAAHAADRLGELLAGFRTHPFEGKNGRFTCSFSAGTASWRGNGETLEDLLRRADAALYTAKDAGRAAVHQAGDAAV